VFPPGAPRFASPAEQRGYLEQWTRAHIHAGRADPRFEVAFYSGRWVAEIGAIIPSGDIIGECVPDAARRDVALLEEPEHLNWYKVQPFKRSFVFVAGVVHTNYLAYRLRDAHVPEPVRELWAAGFELLGREVAAAACHRIVKLSDAVGEWHGAVTENVHGVRPHFLAVGDALRAAALAAGGPAPAVRFRGGAYYIGKALWTKGYRELLDVCAGHKVLFPRPTPGGVGVADSEPLARPLCRVGATHRSAKRTALLLSRGEPTAPRTLAVGASINQSYEQASVNALPPCRHAPGGTCRSRCSATALTSRALSARPPPRGSTGASRRAPESFSR